MILSTAVSLLVGLSIAIALIAANDPGAILRLLLETGWWLPAVLALNAAQIVASGLAWGPLIEDPRRPGVAGLAFLRWVRVSANALLPIVQAMGELIRAQLLVRMGVAKVRVIASLAIDLVTEMASQIVFSLMGLAALLLLPQAGGSSATTLAVIGTALGAAMAGAFMAAQRWGLFRIVERSLPRVAARIGWTSLGELSGLNDAAQRLYAQPGRLWRSGLWHMLSWLLGVAETWAAMQALGIPGGLGEALVIESLGQAVRSAGFFIPGALGVQEGGYVLICAAFGIPPERAIALVLLRRVRDVLLGLPGIVAWRWSVRLPRPVPGAGLPGDGARNPS